MSTLTAKPRSDGLPALLGSLPLTLLFLTLVLTPLVLTLLLSFAQFDYNTGIQPGYTLDQYLQVLTDGYFLEIFWRTFWIAALTTLICVLVGAPEAYILSRNAQALAFHLPPGGALAAADFPGGARLRLEPAAGPWRPAGQGRRRPGPGPAALHAHGHHHRPGARDAALHGHPGVDLLQKLDPTMEQAAYSLNASRAQTLWRVVLPQAMPGVLSGSLIVFGLAASSFAIPALLGGRRLKMVATIVYDEFLTELNWPLGAAIAVLLLVANVIIMMSYNRVVERSYRRSLG